jgi:hypothetical protein
MELTEQVRASGDPGHTAVVGAFRDLSTRSPVTPELIHKFPAISAQDVAEDPLWRFAPVIVTTNQQRELINRSQLLRFAAYHNLPVFKWRLDLAGVAKLDDEIVHPKSRRVLMTKTEVDNLYNNEANLGMWGYFVLGAPGYITDNVGRGSGGCEW